MKTILIAGSHSGVGKTYLAESIVRSFPGYSALKLTVRREGACPRNKNCASCGDYSGDYLLVADDKEISRKGTDTARLRKAGAKKVVWLKANLKGLKEGLKKAMSELQSADGIIIEGASALKYLRPDVAIYLKKKSPGLKSSAKEAQRKADIIIDV